MSSNTNKVQFTEPIYFLNLIGYSPFSSNYFALARQLFFTIIYTAATSLILMELLLNYDGLDSFARAAEILVPQYQVIWKFVVLIKSKRKILDLIRKADIGFWPLDKFGAINEQKLAIVHRIILRSLLFYKFMIFGGVLQFLLTPLIVRSDKPAIMCYGESNDDGVIIHAPYIQLIYILHGFYVFVISNIFVGFDGLFFYFIAHILTELKMVKYAFSDDRWIDDRKLTIKKQRFNCSVQQHSYVLDFIRDTNNVYSFLLLHQYFSSLFGICFGIFMMTKDGIPPDSQHFTKYSSYIFSAVSQIWVFCYAGNKMTEWSSLICDIVFYKYWDTADDFKDYKTGKMIVIQRTQKEAKLTIGGFFDLNLETFSMVVRNALSFFTFMNAIYEEEAVS